MQLLALFSRGRIKNPAAAQEEQGPSPQRSLTPRFTNVQELVDGAALGKRDVTR